MSGTRLLPFGTWPSPITAERVSRASVSLGGVLVDGDATTWVESRPLEQGRYVIVRADPWASGPVDVTPPGFSARTRVHEYGGGAYTVRDGVVYFSNDDDQRLYRQEPGAEPAPITPEPSVRRGLRYADMDLSPDGGRLACVRERHAGEGLPVNELVVVPADGSNEPSVVATGRDFYAFPRWSPDGSSLAWIGWDMPNMPWDGTELEVAPVADGVVGEARAVAGGPRESIFQPAWGPDGRLHFASDRTGWWNLYREEPDGSQLHLTPMAAEFAVPMWVFGMSTYAFLADGRIACVYRRAGEHHLAVLDPGSFEMLDLDVPYACFEPYLRASGTRLAFLAGGPKISNQVVTLDFATRAVEVLHEGEHLAFDPAYLSEPRAIEFPTPSGTAYAYHYPPMNPDAEPLEGSLPPLLVHIHGGPTSEVTPRLDLQKQYFTSRGFAFVDVNYGGSTGYGRAFRDLLYGRWGVVDVQDAVAAASHLVEHTLADPGRLLIDGGSAGGWTTLCALTFTDTFAAGTSLFGVSDLEPFVAGTHKFELRYVDLLVGPWPEAADLWRERSPVRHAERISSPLLILQGDEDEVVPPSQAEVIVQALEERGVPYAYLLFEGEQHGFRKAESIARALEAELTFYGRVLGFDPADDLPPLEIRNLPKA
ncbi:MAG TPA: S9 family peptidase [Actinomycetota bacterium]|nr:S9 family peptidase [Actinomycetota bacterium]